jgi:DNA-binding SARP family transcriptional activator
MTSTRDGGAYPLELGVLGPFLARVDGRWLPAPTRQTGRLATVLAGRPGEVVDRDRIIAALWGAAPPATATNTLQVHVSQLRAFIGRDSVQVANGGYLLDVDEAHTDTGQFVAALQDATRLRRAHHYRRAVERLMDAQRLWRGTPYPDVHDPELLARRARLIELCKQGREDLLECRLELAGDPFALAEVVADAIELAGSQPDRERSQALLVRALTAAGRTREAGAAYDAAKALVQSAGGTGPGPLLVAARDGARTNDPKARPRAASAVTNLPAVRHVSVDARPIAESVRRAVVDEGADVVTVVTADDADARAALAVALGEALAGDLIAGAVRLDAQQATRAGLDEVVRQASDGTFDGLDALPDRGALAVIVDVAGEGVVIGGFVDDLTRLPNPPRVIVMASGPVRCDREVVMTYPTAVAGVEHLDQRRA